ncbi:hypothetical protein HR060_09500 [Catenovulum sp. SM1970]|uniref:hypothetical protein n=1 Tax=Marinifaba aquimaris TaxID=2741323 RepID=UPI0015728673|nr:hypothetical protein [Marinifaba aquimaris]NTS77108.1 hypothetical protein [Marinifaba aquimaris]
MEPDITQPQIPMELSVLNLLLLPVLLFGLYSYAYKYSCYYLTKIRYFWDITACLFILTNIATLAYEFSAGGYSQEETIIISILTAIFLTPNLYVFFQLSKQLKGINYVGN